MDGMYVPADYTYLRRQRVMSGRHPRNPAMTCNENRVYFVRDGLEENIGILVIFIEEIL